MDPERLISDYLDDALTPQEVDELFQWIHSQPDNAKRFAAAAYMHRQVQHRLSAMRVLEEQAGLTIDDEQNAAASDVAEIPAASAHDARPVMSRAFASRRLRAVAAAILVVVGLLAFVLWPRSSPARLLTAHDATWGAGVASVQQGGRLPKGALVLESGVVKIGFDNGNQLLIEGPARFSITGARDVTLDQGSLTTIVTEAGRGLAVTTTTARVTDLGTEFGVKASATATRVIVFDGKVSVAGNGTTAQELSAGIAVEVSKAGIRRLPLEQVAFRRVTSIDHPPLDLIDLLAGGDGRGSASGVGIDAATGGTSQTKAVTIRRGDQRYVPVSGHRVLDGCFIPGGRMPVDSAGQMFTFPITSLFSYGLVWTGPNIPWEGELPIATTLPQDAGGPTSRVLVMHSNNGLTLNLDAIRALHGQMRITGFRAVVGNSYRPATPSASPARPLASIHVIVDGVARFENPSFTNVDGAIEVSCALSDSDRFLSLATTDGGDGNACDWVLWTRPEFVLEPRAP